MAGDRIDSLTEARRLRREHGEEDVAYFLPRVASFGDVRHGVTGVGMDGIEADFATLRQAERDLAALHDDLLAQLKDAAELTGPLGDGTSPVTRHMRKAFLDRADLDGGVQTALLDYMEELILVRTAIVATLGTYEGVENDMVERLRTQAAQLEELA
ncbi:hypothetical protein [Actinophytocola glycyrrhizae]|uniref:Ferritin-like metal-binding protein YciE n=1 Tax=Actinophytocola glycyrrhizae TaxID=2044873 RepID=A0ABV9SCK1_9PSEU